MQVTNGSVWLLSRKRKVLKLLSTTLLMCWISLLTTYTVQLQNSCTPLLEWTNVSTQECFVTTKPETDNHQSSPTPPPVNPPNKDHTNPTKAPEHQKKDSRDLNSGSGDVSKSEPPSIDIGKALIGVAVGSAAVVGMAVVGIPVVVAAGVGVTVWVAANILLSSAR